MRNKQLNLVGEGVERWSHICETALVMSKLHEWQTEEEGEEEGRRNTTSHWVPLKVVSHFTHMAWAWDVSWLRNQLYFLAVFISICIHFNFLPQPRGGTNSVFFTQCLNSLFASCCFFLLKTSGGKIPGLWCSPHKSGTDWLIVPTYAIQSYTECEKRFFYCGCADFIDPPRSCVDDVCEVTLFLFYP